MPRTAYTMLQWRLPEILDTETGDLACDLLMGLRQIEAASAAMTRGLFARSATVEADDLEHLFESTQKDLNPAAPVRRSTSVGDIAVETATGNAFICAAMGWTTLEGCLATRARALAAGHALPAAA